MGYDKPLSNWLMICASFSLDWASRRVLMLALRSGWRVAREDEMPRWVAAYREMTLTSYCSEFGAGESPSSETGSILTVLAF